jgi:HD-GYP domain-containing protein (c-di-GMP phosphodiesterase class II)
MPAEEAIELMIKGRGSHFDPFLFGIFLTLVPDLGQISRDHPDCAEDTAIPAFASNPLAIPCALES